jgi:hypothetical protein
MFALSRWYCTKMHIQEVGLGHGLGGSGSGQGEIAVYCECHNEPLGSMK